MTNEQRTFIETRLQDGLTLRQVFKDPRCTLSRASYYRQPDRLEVPKRKPTRQELEHMVAGLLRDIKSLNLCEEIPHYETAKALLE